MEKQTIERGKLRKAVGRESEGSRKARKNEQRWKVARKKIKYDGNNCERRLELKDLGVMGGGDVVMD